MLWVRRNTPNLSPSSQLAALHTDLIMMFINSMFMMHALRHGGSREQKFRKTSGLQKNQQTDKPNALHESGPVPLEITPRNDSVVCTLLFWHGAK